MWIKAIHKIPGKKIAVIVLSHLIEFSSKSQPSKQNKGRREYFERILRYIDYNLPMITRQWTLEIVQEDEFLMGLELDNKTLNKKTCLCPGYSLDLLSINLSTNTNNDSAKSLGMVDQKDIIEVFI